MPPCMHTSVAPGLPRLLRPVADLLQRERVGVGVGAALRERAEPAAGVADVGEVDVPGDHVGDVVAGRVAAQRVGERGERVQFRRRRRPAAPAPRASVIPAGSRSALRSAAATSPRSRRGAALPPGRDQAAPGRAGRGRSASATSRPVAVDLGEVVPAVGRPAGGVDGDVQVGPAGRLAPAAVRLLPGQAARASRPSRASPVAGSASAATCAASRGSSQGSREVARVDREPLAQRQAGRRGARGPARRSAARGAPG